MSIGFRSSTPSEPCLCHLIAGIAGMVASYWLTIDDFRTSPRETNAVSATQVVRSQITVCSALPPIVKNRNVPTHPPAQPYWPDAVEKVSSQSSPTTRGLQRFVLRSQPAQPLAFARRGRPPK